MKKLKRALALMLAILIVAAVPSSASSLNIMGTNAALGSPILNPSSFSKKNWDDKGKWETIVFGIFTSNFVKPLIDDYESAFDTSSTEGSKGEALKALQFGAGGDVSSNKALLEMIKYTINLSKSSNYMKPITVKKYALAVDSVTELPNDYPATLKDMFIMSYTLVGGNQHNGSSGGRGPTNEDARNMQAYQGGSLTGDWLTSFTTGLKKLKDGIAGEEVQDITSVNTGVVGIDEGIVWEQGSLHLTRTTTDTIVEGMLPKFYVDYMAENTDNSKLILDYTSSWDIQILSTWLNNTFNVEGKNKVSEDRLKELLEKPLFLDGIGNIVVQDGSRNLMVLPSAANQHITKNTQYNLLQSVIFGGNYIEASETELITRATAGNWDWINPIDGSDLGKGKTVLLFDSNSHIVEQAKADTSAMGGELGINKTLVIPQTSSILFGSIFSDIIKANFADGRNSFTLATVGSVASSNYTIVSGTAKAAAVISQAFSINKSAPVLSEIDYKSTKLKIFGEPVVVSTWEHDPKTKLIAFGDNIYKDREPNYGSMLRYYPNHILTGYEANKPDVLNLLESVKSSKTVESTTHTLLTGLSDLNTPINDTFKALLELGSNKERGIAVIPSNFSKSNNYYFESLHEYGITNSDGTYISTGYKDAFKRIAKVYPTSETIRIVSSIMGLRASTSQEFAAYTPWIYLTYLNWYGVTGGSGLQLNQDLYNPGIVDAFDIEKATDGTYMSEEEKKQKILEYTYMVLDPEAGKDYRANMITDNFNGWAQKTYQNIVYGGAISIDSSSTLSNRYSTGFLKVDSYADNFTTKWFMGRYTDIIVIVIGFMMIAMVIVGIVLRKKIAWFAATALLVINITLLLPAMGEVTPYIANSMIQRMFSDKMSYWAISEGVANATINKKANKEAEKSMSSVLESQLDSNEANLITSLVRSLNLNYSDRAVMLRLDISKKITESQIYNFDEIQSLESARWLLPTMIRQFSANDGSKDYIYTPLADSYDNLSNLYWVLNPNDAILNDVNLGIESTTGAIQEKNMGKTDILLYNEGYRDISNNPITQANLINNQTYRGDIQNETWQSISRSGEQKDKTKHTFSYLLKTNRPIPAETNNESLESYLETKSELVSSSLKAAASDIEIYAGTYRLAEPYSVQPDTFGFLWATENPMHYFYQVAKDTFPIETNLAELAGELQGEFINSRDTGEEVRSSFMYFSDSNEIRDFLDMEELFTNVMPYLYKVQLLAGGIDGKTGIFGDELIENYEIYKFNRKSWLFRSNWVTKIMENSKYNSAETVLTSAGTEVYIEQPLDPKSYPAERPMVFSAAQMVAQGLNESKLTLPELKILKINEAVEQKWTLMLNYVNIPGMTKEVIMRQMALESLLEFNKEFSTSAPLNSALTMYPNGLDLRNLSFDSVMKMLMLNTTKDTRFIYGDTMTRVIENTDLFSTVLLLAGAFLCAYIIPFVRNVVLGMLFYIGLWALFTNILSSGKSKIKITTAFVINNILFLLVNIAFYLVFSSMISLTYSDNVLTTQNISVNVGNPIWIFLIVLMAGLAYIKASVSIINVCFKNSRDMGYEVYATWSGMVADKISSGIKGAQSVVTSYSESSVTRSSVQAPALGDTINRRNIDDPVDGDENRKAPRKKVNEQRHDSGHVLDKEIDPGADESEIIDREIKKGRKITNGEL